MIPLVGVSNDLKILALEQLIMELAEEVREWLCEECNTVYPGPPKAGLHCVICPQCGGTTAPRNTVEKHRAELRCAELVKLLEKYGRHHPECAINLPFGSGKCNCYLSVIMQPILAKWPT